MRIGLIALGSLLVSLAANCPAGDLSLSASVEVSRPHQAWLSEAEDNLNAGRFAETIQSLQNVLDAEVAFVSRGPVVENSHAAARRLLKTLPPAWLGRYEEQFGGTAHVKLRAAKTKNDPAAIRRVFEQHPFTQAGFQALRLSAIRHFDHGEFLPAAAGFQAVSEHPFAQKSKNMPAADAKRWIIAVSQLGFSDQARQIAARHRKELNARNRTWILSVSQTLTSPSSSQVIWEKSLPLPEAAEKLLGLMKKELHHRGFLLPAIFSPIIAGDRVIARSLSEIAAYDGKTGEIVWRKSTKPQALDLAETGLSNNSQFRKELAWQIGASAYAGKNAATLTSDGSRVFAVLTDQAADAFANISPLGLNPETQDHWDNLRLDSSQLMALDASTGNELWRYPAKLPSYDPALRFSRRNPDSDPAVFFFGPPLPLGGSLYAMGQSDREIRLYVISPETGQTEWSLRLAMAELPLMKDPMRRRLACPVAFTGSLLLCPTGAGALAAVDPFSRSVRWTFRYVRDDLPEIPTEVWPARGAAQHAPDDWWRGWRDVALIVCGETVLLTSPESDQVQAISLGTGEPLWTLPRGDGFFLAETGTGPVLLIGPQTVRAIDPDKGEVVWTIPTPMPAGRGFLRSSENGSSYVLPLLSGGVLEIDPVHKTARRSFPLESQPWGNLVAEGEMIIMQTHDRLVRLAPLEPGTEPPSDALSRLAWAKSQREAGRFRGAAVVLRDLVKASPTDEAVSELREMLLAELEAHPERVAVVVPVLEPVLQNAEDRIRGWRALAEAEQRTGHLPNSLRYWLKLIDENPAGSVTCSSDPALEVEYSRYVQGAIRDLLNSAEPEVKDRLEAQLDEYREKTLSRRDPFASSRLARQFDQLKWGRELIAEEQHRTGIGQSPLEQQLALWALTEVGTGPAIQASAYRRLAEDHLSELRFRESAFFLGQLRDRFANIQFSDGQTVSTILDSLPMDSPVRKHLQDNFSRWPASAPRITEERRSARLPGLFAVPVHAEPGSLGAELNVWLEHERRRLHFSGGGHSGFWELALPGDWPAYDMGLLGTWVAGPVLVLQDGSNLVGISPADDHGQPRARALWQARLFDGEKEEEHLFDEITDYRQHQPAAGFGDFYGELLDAFRQGVAQVGSVSAGAVVYQTGGRLVALETATGRQLWSRSQLPTEAFLTGDASHVLLMERDKSRVTVLRTLDGRIVASRDLPTDGKFLTWWKTRALFQKEAPDRLMFSLWDALAGRFVWEQTAPLKSLGFEVDGRLWGFITPEGKLTLFQTETGRALETTELPSVRNPNQVHAFSDESGIYLAISHPKTPADEEESPIVDDLPLRHPILAGTLHGLDRSGKHLWQSSWGHWAFPLEQPAAGPVLVLAHREKSGPDSTHAVIRCLDKRTGHEIYHAKSTENPESPRWSGSPEQGQFELKAYGNTVRLRYD